MKRWIIILLYFSYQHLYAQDGLKGNHWAVKHNGDTLFGFIEEIGETKITIASLKGDEYKVIRLSTKSVAKYKIKDDVFVNVPLDKRGNTGNSQLIFNVFLKEISGGQVGLYERNISRLKLMDPESNSDAMGFLHKISSQDLYLYSSGTKSAKKVNEDNFYEIASLLMGDKKRIKQRLNTAYYTFENMDQLLLDYNYLVENNLE